MNTMTLGQKILELRITKGLTQSDLGSGLVTSSMISQIESDKARPSYAVLEAISKKMDTPIEHFVLDVVTQLDASTTHKVGQALLAANKYDEALLVLQNALKTAPQEGVEAAYLTRTLAQAKAALGSTEEAIQQAESAKGMFQQHNLLIEVSQTLSMLGDLYQTAGDHVKSAECFQAMKRALDESSQ